jgi:hypothetical protein
MKRFPFHDENRVDAPILHDRKKSTRWRWSLAWAVPAASKTAMFDCIMPSQLGQRGIIFTSRGKTQLRRSVHKFSEEPVDADCSCSACRDYSRAYLHHLVNSREVLGWHLLTIHNLTFYHRLMKEMREAILRNDFLEFCERKQRELVRTDEEHPNRPVKQRVRTSRIHAWAITIYTPRCMDFPASARSVRVKSCIR